MGEEIRLTIGRQPGPQPVELVAAPWPNEINRFFIRVAGIQDNRTSLAPSGDGVPGAVITLATPGVTMFVLDWLPEIIEVEPGTFRDFLTGLVPGSNLGTVAEGRPVRVRHVRSAKALIRVSAHGPQPPDAETATSKSGQSVEIRPIFDPTITPVGADLGVRVYVRGDSEGGTRVRAVHAATGRTAELVTNAKGIGDLPVSGAGPWRLEFHTAKRLPPGGDADWEVCSGTLAFSTPIRSKEGEQ